MQLTFPKKRDSQVNHSESRKKLTDPDLHLLLTLSTQFSFIHSFPFQFQFNKKHSESNRIESSEFRSLSPKSKSKSMIHFVLLISRQGKVRLTKWYSPYTQKERSKVIRELSGVILSRAPKLCNFVEWRGYKVVYKRYASLYFCMCIDDADNELEVLEMIHHFVEILDRYFGSVCELDLIFNFHKAYYILDEILIAGELQESSKKTVARLIAAQDSLVETAKEEASSLSNIIAQATK